MQRDELTESIIGCCYEIHSELGPGFQEKIYHSALKKALEQKGIPFSTEKRYGVVFQEAQVGSFRVDLLVGESVVVEVKAVHGLMPKVFESQVLAYLKAAGLSVGLLVNFGNNSCQIRRLMLNRDNQVLESL